MIGCFFKTYDEYVLQRHHGATCMLVYVYLSEYLCSKPKRLKLNQIPGDSSHPYQFHFSYNLKN